MPIRRQHAASNGGHRLLTRQSQQQFGMLESIDTSNAITDWWHPPKRVKERGRDKRFRFEC